MAKIEHNSFGYPNEFVPSSEKLKDEWTYAYCAAALGEMNANESYAIDARADRFISSRKLAEGLRDIDDLKKRFAQDEDLSYLAINHAVSTPTPKLLRIANRTIYNNSYKPSATPIDSMSISKAGNMRNKILHKMNIERMRQNLEAQGVSGVVAKAQATLPKDERELEMRMKMQPKIGEAIGWEYLIRQGLIQNKFEDIQQKLAKDLVDCKQAVCKTWFDNDNNLRISYVDPVNLVTSFVREEDFSDARHLGEIKHHPISELREMMGDKYSEKDLQWIADNGQKSSGAGYRFGDKKYYKNTVNRQQYDNFQVQVMHLQVLQYDRTTHIKKGKKNGGFRIEKKSIDYETPKHAKREREIIHAGAQVIYEGYWVLNTDYVFGWRRKDEAFRDRVNGKWFDTALFDYVVFAPGIYDMTNKSVTETIGYHDDQLFQLELKIQQYLLTAHPPGYVYNIDAILGAIEGMGLDNMEVLDMVKIKAQNGSMYVSSRDQDNELVNAGSGIDPVRKLESGLDEGFNMLLVAYDKRLQMMKEVIGVNDAVDGSQPDKKALVGIQKLAAEGHKAALADLNKAYEYITRETSRRVYLGFKTQIREGINVKELEASIGELNIKEIKLKSVGKADCSIDVEMLPDALQMEMLTADLQDMVKSGVITASTKYSVLRVANESMKNAEVLLGYMEEKSLEEKQANAEKNIQLQTEGNAKVAEVTAQMEQQNLQLKYKLEQDKELAVIAAKSEASAKDWIEKKAFATVDTDLKKELMKLDAKLKKEAEDTESVSEDSGTGLDNSSVTRLAGKVEPQLGLNQPTV